MWIFWKLRRWYRRIAYYLSLLLPFVKDTGEHQVGPAARLAVRTASSTAGVGGTTVTGSFKPARSHFSHSAAVTGSATRCQLGGAESQPSSSPDQTMWASWFFNSIARSPAAGRLTKLKLRP